jgi:hypothetical protein
MAKSKGDGMQAWRRSKMISGLLLSILWLVFSGWKGASAQEGAQTVAGTSRLSAIACNSSDICYAVGSSASDQGGSTGVLVEVTRGVAGAAQPIPGTTALTGIVCAGPSRCYAIGYSTDSSSTTSGVLVDMDDGQPFPAQTLAGVAFPAGIDCMSAGQCYLAGSNDIVPVLGGIAFAPAEIDAASSLAGVACPLASLCYVVGTARQSGSAILVEISDALALPADSRVLPEAGGLLAIACPSPDVCYAGGDALLPARTPQVYVPGVVLTLMAGTTTSFQPVVDRVTSLTCASGRYCYAIAGASDVPNSGSLYPIIDGRLGQRLTVAGVSGVQGASCSSSSTCYAVGVNFAPQLTGVLAALEAPGP